MPTTSRKRKAPSTSSRSRPAKRVRSSISTSTKITPPTKTILTFPPEIPGTKDAEVHLTDIVLNDDATVTCDYSFRRCEKMGTFQHLGSAFVTESDVRAKAGQWVNVSFADGSEEGEDVPTAPALLVHLFGYKAQEFAVIAWGYRETDDEVAELAGAKEEFDHMASGFEGVVPSDYFQIVETETIESVVRDQAGLPLLDEEVPLGKGRSRVWRGAWYLRSLHGGMRKGMLWRSKTSSKDKAEVEPATSDPKSPETPTEQISPARVIVDAAEAASDAIFGDGAAEKVSASVEKGLTVPRSSIFDMFRTKSPLRDLRKSMSPSRTTVDPGVLTKN